MKGSLGKYKHGLLIAASLLLIVITFFCVYQRNTMAAMDLDTESQRLETRYKYLQSLQAQCDEKEKLVPVKQTAIDTTIAKFPCMISQESAMDLISKLEESTKIKVTAVVPGIASTFYQNGVVTSVSGDAVATTTQVTVQKPALSDTSETLPLANMVGEKTTYTISFESSYKNLMKVFLWLSANQQKVSNGSCAITFDSTSGKLTGTMDVNFYTLWGSGVTYVVPDINDISMGMDNVFGAFE